MFDCAKFCDHFLVVLFVDIRDHITNCLVCLKVLTNDIDTVFGEHVVDLGQDSRNVIVNVYQAMRVLQDRQRQVREVHTVGCVSVVDVVHDLTRHELSDVLLRLQCTATDVRCKDRVRQSAKFGLKLFVVTCRFNGEHVDCASCHASG